MDYQNIKTKLVKAIRWIGILTWIFFFWSLVNMQAGDPDEAIVILVLIVLSIALFVPWFIKRTKTIIKLKNEQKKTELLHLKSQVNPHFFFNTLNNLYGTLERNSPARDMVLKLSDMMRYSLYEGQKELVSIGEELTYISNYLSLQQARYHKENRVTFNHYIIDEEIEIMPLLFIILVENAFKHGLENLEDEAYVIIDLRASSKKLDFYIENNFDKNQTSYNKGIGLVNLKRRLELVYPKKHELEISNKNEVYKVQLSLTLN